MYIVRFLYREEIILSSRSSDGETLGDGTRLGIRTILSNLIHYATLKDRFRRKVRGLKRSFKGEIKDWIEHSNGDLDRR